MYVSQWLWAHAHLRPHHTAVVDRPTGARLSYDQLNRAAFWHALRLQELGVERGDRVAVLAGNRPEILQLLFACARLGAVLVPLNWRLAPVEQERILADCTPRVVLVEEGQPAPDCPHCHPLCRPSLPARVPEPDWALLNPEAPLLILYTGGTTGTPKGAVLTQRSLQWNAWNTIAGWGLGPEDVAPVFTPMFHTGGLNVLATPLLCLGGTVVLPGPFEASSALRCIEEEGCTLVFMVPTMFAVLREAPDYRPGRLARVRLLISGGAPCPQPLMEAYHAEGLPFRQGYGLTEAGPNNFGIPQEEARRHPGSVGRPLPGVRLRLERPDGAPAGPGEVGEVLLAGGHLMSGYWQRPAETAAVFDGTWLRTGDLAYRDEDGRYYICGRSKEMYISGGENVFPAEVEEVLLAHPDVAEAAVVGVPHPRWGETGRAYLVPRPGRRLDAEEVVEFCRTRLARYKAPREVRIVDSLPKSPAGKVLKRLLLEAVPA